MNNSMKVYVLSDANPHMKYFLSDLVLLCEHKLTETKREATAVIYLSKRSLENSLHKFKEGIIMIEFSGSRTGGRVFLEKLLSL